MKNKLFACIILVLVVLQAVFVPVSADGIETGGVSSLRQTTMYEDFGVDPMTSVSDFEDQVIGGSFSNSLPYCWEILTAAIERDFTGITVFLYVYNRGYSALTDNFQVTVGSGTSLYTFDARAVQMLTHSAKIWFRFTGNFSYIDGENVLEIYSISCNGRSSRPYMKELETGSATSSVGLVFDQSTGRLTKRVIGETLDLNVTMMSDRFSTSDLSIWKQLNTCAFIIPNSYFERFGDLALVRFIYDFYSDVPMLVLEQCDAVDDAFSSLLLSYERNSAVPFSVQKRVTHTGNHPGSHYYTYPSVDFSKYFVFPVEEIHSSYGDDFDFSQFDALFCINRAKQIFLRSESSLTFQSFLKASSFSHVSNELSPDDTWSTLSFADHFVFMTAFEQLCYSFLVWGNFQDDSLDRVSAVQVITEDLQSLSSEDLSSEFYVDITYSDTLKSLSSTAQSTDGTLVLLRFCLTDYSVSPICKMTFNGSSFDVTGYVCKNAIIDNFRIISFDFQKTLMTDDGPTVITTTVPVSMDPVTFIEGGESGGKLIDGIVDEWPNPFLGLFSKAKSGFDWLMKILSVFIIVLVVFLIIKVVAFVTSVLRLLNLRKRSSGEDQPKKRRKLFRRKRDRK